MIPNTNRFNSNFNPNTKAHFILGSPNYPKTTNEKSKAILDKGIKLKSFTLRNSNTNHINKKVYHLLLDPFTLDNAYSNLSKNKGAFTQGVNVGNIQGYSQTKTLQMIELLKKGKYFPDPIRRVWIPKPGKSALRPLGIPSFYDKVIQEAMRGILEAVFEPEFRLFAIQNPYANNFGFRPTLGCWDAIKHFTKYAQTSTYVIEGDIKGAYDNVNFNILLNIISRRIKDRKFLNLLNRFLHAGIMDEGKYTHSIIGVPQGGVLSPLLFNIYMFEFDKFMAKLINSYPLLKRNVAKNKSKTYQNLLYKKKGLHKEYKDFVGLKLKDKVKRLELRKKLIKVSNEILKTPSYPSSSAHSFTYTRYADDWILAVGGNKIFTSSLKEKIEQWLKINLKLDLSPDKTKITNIRKTFVPFLGYEILLRSDLRRIKVTNVFEQNKNFYIKRRTTSSKFFVRPNSERLFAKIKQLGLVKPDSLFPIGKRAWSLLDEFQIVQKYQSIFLGLTSHYKNCNTLTPLNRLSYIFKFSCAKTLATRKRLTMGQVLSKYGPNLAISRPYLDDPTKIRKVEFMGLTKIRALYFNKPLTEKGLSIHFDPFKVRTFWRTTFKLYSQCCICGSDNNIEMHHTNSLKNIKIGKNNQANFNKILKQLNRKQIPVCHQCHVTITNKTYSGKSLSEFFSQSLASF
jgi:group II intron reverse transcriptase/maturase